MAGGQKVGRPTKYSASMLKKARYYIKNYQEYGDLIPNAAGLAIELGVSKSTVYLWASNEKNKEFSDALEMISTNQERQLLTGGLSGSMNPTISKLILTNHGYSDKPKEDDGGEAPSLNISFSVKQPASEIKVTHGTNS